MYSLPETGGALIAACYKAIAVNIPLDDPHSCRETQIFVRAAAEADLENLDERDRRTLAFELFSWAESAPPQETRRDVLGIEMFDDTPRADSA